MQKVGCRLDAWLWMVRLYASRTLAADQCQQGKVLVDGQVAKAAKRITGGESISVKKNGILNSCRVIAIPSNRVGAALVPEYKLDTTPPEEIEKAKQRRANQLQFGRFGDLAGRPTKRNARKMQDFFREITEED